MFPYFGSKGLLAKLYPKPQYPRIIEPFAGSARYACRYPDREVHLNDLSPVVVGVWQWIIAASPAEIRDLPEPVRGESLNDIRWLTQPERDLLGFCMGVGRGTVGGGTPSPWSLRQRTVAKLKGSLLRLVDRVRHWTITNLPYDQLDASESATWFVDPPYQEVDRRQYPAGGGLDFLALGAWCRQLRGQPIVCDAGNADWLPFRPVKRAARGVHNTGYNELIWTRCDKKVGFGQYG